MGRCVPAPHHDDGNHEWHDPEPEHDLDLAKEMQQLGGDAGNGWHTRGDSRGVASLLQPVRRLCESSGQEGVQNRQHEDRGCDPVKGIGL